MYIVKSINIIVRGDEFIVEYFYSHGRENPYSMVNVTRTNGTYVTDVVTMYETYLELVKLNPEGG